MRQQRKLPVKQLIILSICRFAEPIAYTSILPYLPEMIESFGVPKDDIGKWAGICGSAFSFAQCMTAAMWGRASDHFGRKPTILAGLILTMFTSLLFGFSTSLGAAIAIRALAGLGNGNGGIIRATAAEMAPSKELQPRVFSMMPMMWNVGSFIGPVIGGGLVHPAERYPGLFGRISLFKEFPYALPNLVNCSLFAVGIVTGWLFLRETLPTMKGNCDYGIKLAKVLTAKCGGKRSTHKLPNLEEAYPMLSRNDVDETDIANSAPKKCPETTSFTWKAVFTAQSRVNLLESLTLGMHSVAFDQLLPIFMHHPRSKNAHSASLSLCFSGGFGLDSARIGYLLMLNGLLGMFAQFFVFPPVAKTFGVLRCLRVCAVMFIMVYVVFPFTSLIPSENWQQAVALALIVFKNWLTVFAFPCNAILLTNSSASAKMLGTLNGVETSIAAAGRTIGPALGGIMFVMGVDVGYMVIPWWAIAGVAAGAALPTFWMEDAPPPKDIIADDDSGNDGS